MNLLTVFKKKAGLIVEKKNDSYLLMRDSDGVREGVCLENTAVDLFELCDGENTVLDIINAIMEEYEVDYQMCLQDVKECLNIFLSEGIIVKCRNTDDGNHSE